MKNNELTRFEDEFQYSKVIVLAAFYIGLKGEKIVDKCIYKYHVSDKNDFRPIYYIEVCHKVATITYIIDIKSDRCLSAKIIMHRNDANDIFIKYLNKKFKVLELNREWLVSRKTYISYQLDDGEIKYFSMRKK